MKTYKITYQRLKEIINYYEGLSINCPKELRLCSIGKNVYLELDKDTNLAKEAEGENE